MAHGLGQIRLLDSLQAAHWAVIDEVVDETTYVAARDPDGMLWAIGVAEPDSSLRGYIERDMKFDDRWAEISRVAFAHPLDTMSADRLLPALEDFA